jgi:hypothetical protein
MEEPVYEPLEPELIYCIPSRSGEFRVFFYPDNAIEFRLRNSKRLTQPPRELRMRTWPAATPISG